MALSYIVIQLMKIFMKFALQFKANMKTTLLCVFLALKHEVVKH